MAYILSFLILPPMAIWTNDGLYMWIAAIIILGIPAIIFYIIFVLGTAYGIYELIVGHR
ncbi:MAG: hypothetical protein JSW11_00435 [Candidatus Heimdallarchaeota archaeon]|nr:MAG: hypothetical protein JSW11_00435 [Candidatus Heimdallarchaeota archaeon]